jgi:hypothetical protein
VKKQHHKIEKVEQFEMRSQLHVDQPELEEAEVLCPDLQIAAKH